MAEISSPVMTPVLTPRSLREGDRIAIVSPAGAVDPDFVATAADVLRACGWQPYVAPHALGRYGNFSATDSERFRDLSAALTDSATRAIFCSRGGFGAVHLLEKLSRLPLRRDPKWIIGFSDISALHGLMSWAAIESVHSPMARHLANTEGNDADSQRLFALLRGDRCKVLFPADPRNRCGKSFGRLLGGNMAVISGLLSTPFNVIRPGTVLFIEDIAEPVYKVDRMFHTLLLNGTLPKLGGLIAGQFTDCRPGPDGRTVEDMIAAMVAPYDYPVAFNAPVGHVAHNVPLVCSAMVRLNVSPSGVELDYVGRR